MAKNDDFEKVTEPVKKPNPTPRGPEPKNPRPKEAPRPQR